MSEPLQLVAERVDIGGRVVYDASAATPDQAKQQRAAELALAQLVIRHPIAATCTALGLVLVAAACNRSAT